MYCLNPNCPTPQNPQNTKFCLSCGFKLLLRERYRAIKPIGQGGFGRTFLAVDEDKPSKPPCVIKQFYPQAQGTSTVQKATELFNQEAVRLDELGRHPQIPELLAYFTQDDRQYLVQQFIDGQNLAEELAENGAFNEAQIRQLLNDLLQVLQFVHQRQVIHRDIKPENIIRNKSDRKLFLVDFGASKIVTNTSLYQQGTSIGSPEYVAPEQVRGQAIFASDIYSLGATCIHLLTQISPFDLYDINEDAWVWQQYLTSNVNPDLGKILNKMLESVPSRRYQSVDEVLKDFNKIQNVQVNPLPVAPTPKPPSPQPNPQVFKPASKAKSSIDDELAEISSQFLNSPPATNKNQPSASPKPATPSPAKSKSQVDLELEDLKSEFLGYKNPNNTNI
ncbi:serine/threonine protein kinase [Crinalium epipsammum PCC 9333]|uniref:non-specific serine/threonine protein kinase n=2 Tax=Crinalium TaxID=241421 RepID=K9W2E8_9CYAN|nr:serine/threonine protein kinase [Crinalium epipsammum PCC 9333]